MGSGGDGGIVDELNRSFKDGINVVTQGMSGGLLGFDGDDGFGLGATGQSISNDVRRAGRDTLSGLDRLTGRDIAEEEIAASNRRFQEEQQNRKDLLADEAKKTERSARAASARAGTVRSRATNKTSSLGDSGDFLGL